MLSVIIASFYAYMYEFIYSGNYWPFMMDLFTYSVTTVLLLLSHGKIAYVARNKRKQIANLELHAASKGENANSNRPRTTDKATMMMLVMVGAYLLFWLPSFVSSIIILVSGNFTVTIGNIRVFGSVLVSFNSSVNFIIYAVVNRKFRYAYKLLLTCKKENSGEFSFQV